MLIVAEYSFNKGKEIIEEKFPNLLGEIKTIIAEVEAEQYKTKISGEKTMKGKILYSPICLNSKFKERFTSKAWKKIKIQCDYSTNYYLEEFKEYYATNIKMKNKSAVREMDFLKNKLGVEVQFGKYAFMVYNVCAKMTIFKKLSHIEAGIEIVSVKRLADEMSTGVADIDIPVLILGIDSENIKNKIK